MTKITKKVRNTIWYHHTPETRKTFAYDRPIFLAEDPSYIFEFELMSMSPRHFIFIGKVKVKNTATVTILRSIVSQLKNEGLDVYEIIFKEYGLDECLAHGEALRFKEVRRIMEYNGYDSLIYKEFGITKIYTALIIWDPKLLVPY